MTIVNFSNEPVLVIDLLSNQIFGYVQLTMIKRCGFIDPHIFSDHNLDIWLCYSVNSGVFLGRHFLKLLL